jgi:AraC family transcriptional regulator, transcriptional activator of pobA
MKVKSKDIPSYELDNFRHVHRLPGIWSGGDPAGAAAPDFGNNNLDPVKGIRGFELYSSHGLIGSVGPLRSAFYRISITVTGELDMQIGLRHYRHLPRTICFTFPNQIFSKNNISADASGYYMLFRADFFGDLLPAARLPAEFPFLNVSGTPLFQLLADELSAVVALVYKMDEEVRSGRPEKTRAVQLYLYLLLVEAKRSYERQELDHPAPVPAGNALVARFLHLVSEHFLERRKVADYAALLSVSANHLNKVVREVTGKTASENISEMLLQEARSLLRYTDRSVAEIAYGLDFSDPASFNRFFKGAGGETPLAWRKQNA